METIIKALAVIFAAVVLGFIVAVITAYPAMLLWNWLMPELFNFKTMGFWQMLGFIVLLRILIPTSTSSSSKD